MFLFSAFLTFFVVCVSSFAFAAPVRLFGEKDYSKPLVTCHLSDEGLGHQLFQIASTLAYAWEYNATPIFPDLNAQNGSSTYRDKFFFRLDSSQSPRPLPNAFREQTWHSSEKIPFVPDQILIGYFQSWKHFHKHRDKLILAFSPTKSDKADIRQKYHEIIKNPNTVGVHVRTFNAKLHQEGAWPFLGLEYYKNCFELFPEGCLFVVFSDRIEWCKKHFPQFNKKFVFIEGNDAAQDFLLMSQMKNNIIANSTFSWWAAYLNKNPYKIVVAPRFWQDPDYYFFPPSENNDFFLPEWKLIPANFKEPYPDDINV